MTEDTSSPPRRRPVLGISGWVLFVCLFLPTVRVCGDPTAPIEFPPVYGAYLGGLAVGIAAFSLSLRVRRISLGLTVGMYVATAMVFVVALVADEMNGPLVGVSILASLGATIYVTVLAARTPWTPRALAIGWFAHGCIVSGWNTLLFLDPQRMWGAGVAIVASGVMLVDAVIAISVELGEIKRRRAEHTLPVARTLR
ncbi:MAG: hypothetical protein SFX73_12760 [Kofleriaceae bacterium]|nr:hypothetical protein [Kofleriaceae bacterium]